MKKINIQLPENVRTIITALQSHGHEAYAVGGCVRDSILGRVPGDWDITTSAMPEETKEIFDRTFDTGIEHGTITVLMGKEGYEVTTYRIDGEYEDSRHPKEVVFTRNLKEDLLRRDFTINAMAYNETDGVVDIFGGMEDLKAGIIRCVGNARDRFSEDALRILRGVRFAAQLGFEIEEETKAGMRELAPTLKNISAERIQTELIKMLVSPRPDMLREAYQLGITKQFLPEFDRMMETEQENPHHIYNVGEHTLHAMCNVEADKVLRFTMLLHDVGKIESKEMDEDGVAHFYMHVTKGQEMAKKILRRLKFDNDTIRRVTHLVEFHDYSVSTELKNVRRALNKIGEDYFEDYLKVRRADVNAQSIYKREEKIQDIEDTERLYREIVAKNQCVSLKKLAVTGKDLIDAGMAQGKELGATLQWLLEQVIENPENNTKERLLELALHRADF